MALQFYVVAFLFLPEDFMYPSNPCSVQLHPNTPENQKNNCNKTNTEQPPVLILKVHLHVLFYPGTDTVDGGIAQC